MSAPGLASPPAAQERALWGILPLMVFLAFMLYGANIGTYFIAADYTHLGDLSAGQAAKMWYSLRHNEELLTREYRPFAETVYAIERQLFADQPAGYHAVSFALHGVVGFLLFLLMYRLGLGRLPALAAAWLWLFHPVLTDIVAWMCVQADQWAALWLLLALLSLWRPEHSGTTMIRRGVAFLGFGWLGFCSKEMALTLPFLASLLLWAPGLEAFRAGWTRHAKLTLTALGYAMFTVYWIFRLGFLGGFGGYGPKEQLRIGWFLGESVTRYLSWFLGFIRGDEAASMLYQSYGVPVVAALAVTLALSPWRYRHGMLWMGLALIPVYTVVKNTNSYIPLMGMCWLFGTLIADLHRSENQILRQSTALIMVTAIGLAGRGTLGRMADFREASAITWSFRQQLVAQVPAPANGTMFFFSGLPDQRKGVFVLGVGTLHAVRLAYPGRTVQGYPGHRMGLLDKFRQYQCTQARFFTWRDGLLLAQPERDRWFREEHLATGPPREHPFAKTATLFRAANSGEGWKLAGGDSSILAGEPALTDGPSLRVNLPVDLPAPSRLESLEFVLEGASSMRGFTHITWEWFSPGGDPLGIGHHKVLFSAGTTRSTFRLIESVDWFLSPPTGHVRLTVFSPPARAGSVTVLATLAPPRALKDMR